MSNIVVVDGGASGCRMAVFTAQGEVLARIVINEHASLSMGVTQAWQHINLGLTSLRQQLGYVSDWQPAILCMGLAGSQQLRKRTRFLGLVASEIDARVYTDGYAQLVGATAGTAGICLAVGTGSVVHWLASDGSTSMAGGWGFPAGDQGSGAWLGMRALQHLTHCRDLSVRGGAMVQAVESLTGSSVSDIQSWTTQTRSNMLAQLAPLVFEAADAGDIAAQDLLEEAVDHCMQLIDHAPTTLPVYAVGGVGAALSPALGRRLGGRLETARGDALRGLWHLATRQLA